MRKFHNLVVMRTKWYIQMFFNRTLHFHLLRKQWNNQQRQQLLRYVAMSILSLILKLAPQFRSNTSTSNYGTMSQFSPATHSSSSSLPSKLFYNTVKTIFTTAYHESLSLTVCQQPLPRNLKQYPHQIGLGKHRWFLHNKVHSFNHQDLNSKLGTSALQQKKKAEEALRIPEKVYSFLF